MPPFGIGGLFTPLPSPVSGGGGFNFPDIGSLFNFGGGGGNTTAPVTNTGSGGMADVGAGLTGAAGGAATGAAVGGPIGAGVGAGLGFLAGLFGKPTSSGQPASGNAGLLDGLQLGLGSLGGGGGLGGLFGGSTTVTQSQAVNQENNISVQNILGREFGGVDSSGNFDAFQAIADVFTLRNALNQSATGGATGGVGSVVNASPQNNLPLIIAGGALLLVLLMGKR
jgi:hypothetical protein